MKRFFILGVLFGFGLAAFILPRFLSVSGINQVASVKQDSPEKYPLLAKRIFTGNPSDMIINFVQLRENFKSYIAKTGENVGLYFEYLPTGIHIGLNDRDEFYRASLVKVPLIMQVYKMIEDGFIKKDEQLMIRRDLLDNSFGELWKTGAGTSRSIDELVRLVLAESDNTAYAVLLDRVNQVLEEKDPRNESGIEKIYDFLDVPRDEKDKTFKISPRSYASILKSLFFSSYLNFSNSSEILGIMSESTFVDWMPKNLPGGTKVAHKVGIFQGTSPDKSVNSDCGIVYIPNRPFLICIMVRSGDTEKAVPYINEITKMAYEYLVITNVDR